ncbi:unnamed protein product [Calypogeia fissa]
MEWKYGFDLLLIRGMALLPHFCIKAFGEQFYRLDIQAAREADIMGLSNMSLEQGGGVELSWFLIHQNPPNVTISVVYQFSGSKWIVNAKVIPLLPLFNVVVSFAA